MGLVDNFAEITISKRIVTLGLVRLPDNWKVSN